MNRRGFALLTVLWALVALATLAGASASLARRGRSVTRNRVLLARAGWAREACAEILSARFAADRTVRAVDTIELGRGTWCRALVSDPAAAVNVNLVDAELLRRLLGDSLADPLLDWRDADTVPRPLGAERAWYAGRGRTPSRDGLLAHVAELRLVRGFELVPARVLEGLTTRGTGRLDPNLVPAAVLAALPGIDAEARETIVARRSAGRPVGGLDELISVVSPSSQRPMLSAYRDLAQLFAFAPEQLVARIEGGVRGAPLVSTAVLTLVPVEGRLALIARESE
jgi:type II secretory pathway component PulK